ncbi:MAG: methylated-DNA--[protein]-cysteine S-methyltransferase [Phycisphaerae bacterium]|nr:methylated-DNA--[protein]-cysteine S-methyltransferase [Phycisphaerae bacterium]MCZ2400528.1 methylated-DNA--[protein]-cysteine S-methyltransferase [Phycisphaerae bacterium]NUQ50284.1 methylated-DNA--[protein]-cysteine S-methyltransferase [Phycisphaerae bacterium]
MNSFRVVETRAGYVAYVAGGEGLKRVFMPQPSASAAIAGLRREFADARADARLLPDLARELERFFAGERVDFNVTLDVAGAGAFEQAVWRACRRIPYGQTVSYAGLAKRVGRPRAARAVGNAMRRNRFPFVVPCHRVLCSDGSLGGYGGRSGVSFKRDLLDMESAAAAN